jgi:DNA-binding MarR family transcriptional regulator
VWRTCGKPGRATRVPALQICAKEGGSIQPTRKDFENNLRFRVTLRRFLRWSEDQAAAAGLTPAQHQLLVAIKGHPGPEPPAIRDLAEYLLLQSHSAVGLVDRAEAAGVVYRQQDEKDARVVRVHLTDKGDQLVRDLTKAHLAELYNLAEALNALLPATRTKAGDPAAE